MKSLKRLVLTMVICLFILVGLLAYMKSSPIWFYLFLASLYPVFVYAQYFAIHIIDDFKNRGAKYSVLKILACALVAPFFYMSFVTKPYGTGIAGLIINASFVFILFSAIYLITNKLEHLRVQPKEHKNHKLDLLFFMIPSLAVYLYALMGVFPAVLSPDAIYIWTEIQKGVYNNSHPLLYVMLNKLLSLIWNYPAILAIFQILLCSFTYAYVAWRFKKMGLANIYCWLIVIVLTFIPCNLIYGITVFKDVPYTMALILLAMEYIRIFTEMAYFKKISNLVFLGSIVLLVSLTRHNGI